MSDPTPIATTCAGSGASPAEMVILDTVPGMNPKGTCQVCGRYLTLTWYRLPEHAARGGFVTPPTQCLYGLPFAERLHFDPADVVQEWLDDRCDDGAEPRFVIEEFSVRPARDHLPTPERVLEWIEEWSNDNGEWSDDPELGFGGDEALAAADALLDLLATQIAFRMADTLLRELHVTPNPDDPENPLLDGEPTWRKVAG